MQLCFWLFLHLHIFMQFFLHFSSFIGHLPQSVTPLSARRWNNNAKTDLTKRLNLLHEKPKKWRGGWFLHFLLLMNLNDFLHILKMPCFYYFLFFLFFWLAMSACQPCFNTVFDSSTSPIRLSLAAGWCNRVLKLWNRSCLARLVSTCRQL